MSAFDLGRLRGLPVLLALAACVAPKGLPAPVEPPAVTSEIADRQARERTRTRAQFEAARTGQRHQGSGPHSLFDCPHCVDPMKGLVPDDALIDGPMPIWN